MNKYAFWNNKGGTGKTTLCFQLLCQYAIDHPDKRVLVVDVCPQANLSELSRASQKGNDRRIYSRQITKSVF
ncbi:MAG: ParA family protein [Clostridiaceae bacterium]|nr:ParA family protein [Clostridiaceae bacterium]